MHEAFVAAVREAGATVGPIAEAEALIWADPQQTSVFPELIRTASRVRWIQLPYAGIEPFADYLDARFVWTCGKGVYAPPVAEHALTLALAGLRGLAAYSRADRWLDPLGRNLIGASVLILGGGGICASLIDLLEPFECDVTVFRNNAAPISTARIITDAAQLQAVLPTVDVVFIALALTAKTHGIVDQAFLSRMAAHAWLINVARDEIVGTPTVVAAQLHHHTAHRQHARDGLAAHRRARPREHRTLRRRWTTRRAGRRRAGLLNIRQSRGTRSDTCG